MNLIFARTDEIKHELRRRRRKMTIKKMKKDYSSAKWNNMSRTYDALRTSQMYNSHLIYSYFSHFARRMRLQFMYQNRITVRITNHTHSKLDQTGTH